MKEDEIIIDFYVCLHYLANCLFALSENFSEEMLARKILISLTKRFDMKVTTIEEAQDINIINVDELIGSFLTFEMASMTNQKGKKGVPFKADVENDKE